MDLEICRKLARSCRPNFGVQKQHYLTNNCFLLSIALQCSPAFMARMEMISWLFGSNSFEWALRPQWMRAEDLPEVQPPVECSEPSARLRNGTSGSSALQPSRAAGPGT